MALVRWKGTQGWVFKKILRHIFTSQALTSRSLIFNSQEAECQKNGFSSQLIDKIWESVTALLKTSSNSVKI